jgi:hypothetical protein
MICQRLRCWSGKASSFHRTIRDAITPKLHASSLVHSMTSRKYV